MTLMMGYLDAEHDEKQAESISKLVGCKWAKLYGGRFSGNLRLIARMANDRLLGLVFGVGYLHQMYGHRHVEKSGEHVSMSEMDHDKTLELLYFKNPELLTEAETAEYLAFSKARDRKRAERENEEHDRRQRQRRREYLELKREFEDSAESQ